MPAKIRYCRRTAEGTEKLSPRPLSGKFTTLERQVIRNLADRDGLSVSEFIRMVLLRHIQSQDLSGRPNPQLSDIEEARQATILALADNGRIDAHERPGIQRPLSRFQNQVWNPPEEAA